MARYDFLVDTYATETQKTLSIWSQLPDARMGFRPEPRARTPLEQLVHHCLSEEAWMSGMLGIAVSRPALPSVETRLELMRRYAECAAERLAALRSRDEAWFEGDAKFFDTTRSRAWILSRRFLHSAHHRGQLTIYLRLLGEPLFSTYGPTADTGGLPKHGARVVYRYASIDELLDREARGDGPATPAIAPTAPVTERPAK